MNVNFLCQRSERPKKTFDFQDFSLSAEAKLQFRRVSTVPTVGCSLRCRCSVETTHCLTNVTGTEITALPPSG